MSVSVLIECREGATTEEESSVDLLRSLTAVPPANAAIGIAVVIGELVAIVGDGKVPLVCYPGQPGTAALRARTVSDLHQRHIGRPLVLMFEGGDPNQPIVMGVMRGGETWSLADAPAQVEVDVDGQRMHISATHQLVLSCGKASITLTKAGKVLIEGTYVLSRSTGANHIKGGSVDIN